MRMCVACRTRRPQQELIRLTRHPAGGLRVDAARRAPGRGAYLCADVRCLQQAAKRGALRRALGCEPSAAVMDTLACRCAPARDSEE